MTEEERRLETKKSIALTLHETITLNKLLEFLDICKKHRGNTLVISGDVELLEPATEALKLDRKRATELIAIATGLTKPPEDPEKTLKTITTGTQQQKIELCTELMYPPQEIPLRLDGDQLLSAILQLEILRWQEETGQHEKTPPRETLEELRKQAYIKTCQERIRKYYTTQEHLETPLSPLQNLLRVLGENKHKATQEVAAQDIICLIKTKEPNYPDRETSINILREICVADLKINHSLDITEAQSPYYDSALEVRRFLNKYTRPPILMNEITIKTRYYFKIKTTKNQIDRLLEKTTRKTPTLELIRAPPGELYKRMFEDISRIYEEEITKHLRVKCPTTAGILSTHIPEPAKYIETALTEGTEKTLTQHIETAQEILKTTINIPVDLRHPAQPMCKLKVDITTNPFGQATIQLPRGRVKTDHFLIIKVEITACTTTCQELECLLRETHPDSLHNLMNKISEEQDLPTLIPYSPPTKRPRNI